jgi:predicted house-cleaning noncanonical NTP pyrophosphatase (MazG superfamily)
MKPEDSYYNQRRNRLSDVVTEYLTDESLTAKDFYRDLMAEVQAWVDYHEKELKRASEAKNLLEGKFEINLDVPDTITGISSATLEDWNEFWYSPEAQGGWGNTPYTKEQIREFNMKEQAYYDARAKLDAQQEYLSTKSKYYFDKDRNK